MHRLQRTLSTKAGQRSNPRVKKIGINTYSILVKILDMWKLQLFAERISSSASLRKGIPITRNSISSHACLSYVGTQIPRSRNGQKFARLEKSIICSRPPPQESKFSLLRNYNISDDRGTVAIVRKDIYPELLQRVDINDSIELESDTVSND